MQEKLLEKKYSSPELSSVDKIRRDIEVFGYCLEGTKRQVIDEEKTQAAEVLSTRSYDADIPRFYELIGNDLVDEHGVSLKAVLDNGIEYSKADNRKSHTWELERREIERQNLNNIIYAPEGVACIEISSTDLSRPEGELREQGYTGDTLLRISYRNEVGIYQKNIVLKTSDLEILNMLRKHIDRESCKCQSSKEILADMLYVSIRPDKLEAFCADMKNFISNKTMNKTPAKFIAEIIRKSKDKKTDAWQMTNERNDIFEELFAKFELMARLSNIDSASINLMRAGCWQALIAGASSNKNPLTIDDGLAQARAVGSVFTSCGGTITIAPGATDRTIEYSFFDRYDKVKNLLNRIGSIGVCRSCGRADLMYGCGVYCYSCNRIWCNVYLSTGKQLADKEIKQSMFLAYFRA